MLIYLREIQLKDISDYHRLIQPNQTYHKFDGPYYKQKSKEEIEEFINKIECDLKDGKNPLNNKKLIVNKSTEKILGHVNWCWKSKETNWLEVGIDIFDSNNWSKGIGSEALPLWIDEVFEKFPELVRIGLSTWSGNTRMVNLAKKIGLNKEAQYKMARIVDNIYYDSVSYGIIKEEWLKKS
jgi:putative hydrolase of HD superfamily